MPFDLKKSLTDSKIQLLVLFSTLALFLIIHSVLPIQSGFDFISIFFGFLIIVEIFLFVGVEVKSGAAVHGWRHEFKDTLIALIVALLVWFGACILLNTSSPVSAVVSCSMLPNLQRGDFVLVQGAPVSAYDIGMTEADFASLGDLANITAAGSPPISIPGSLYSYCQSRTDGVCASFRSNPSVLSEQKGVFTYHYASCPISIRGSSSEFSPCVSSITFKGTNYLTNFSHDIIVYQPVAGDPFASVGDIVHRVMFRINVTATNGSSSYYYLTRGDNNPVLDIQVYDEATSRANSPVPSENSRGKVLLRIPYLGYYKLFLSGFFTEDPQCQTQIAFNHS